jgi:hypothetical protein
MIPVARRRHAAIGLIALVLLFSTGEAFGQVEFVSPLPDAVVQVKDGSAALHINVRLSDQFRWLDIDVVREQGDPVVERLRTDRSLDTIVALPIGRVTYSLYWSADSAGSTVRGVIHGLTPGHIIGIAGQSNAQGYTWPMIEPARGDIRMLRNNDNWEHAAEPTGNVAGGPWIVMANRLYEQLGDSLPIGIVNTAIGGTGLTVSTSSGQWTRTEANHFDSSIYGSALRRFRHAGSLFEAITWIQGEADGSFLPNPTTYRKAFATLKDEIVEDLGHATLFFHLQISGSSVPNAWVGYLSQVREALRELPGSTLVGTAIGRSLEPDNIHYSVTTVHAVGNMFADAILATRFGKSSPMYPPLQPDAAARATRGATTCSIGFRRNGASVALRSVHDAQYFCLYQDGSQLDTSKVWYSLSSDSSEVIVGLKAGTFDTGHLWNITYCPTAGADMAPIATILPETGDTLYATGFWELPVVIGDLSVHAAEVASRQMKVAAQGNRIRIRSTSESTAILTAIISNECGANMRSEQISLLDGTATLDANLPAGVYWLTLQENGHSLGTFAILLQPR